MRPLIGLRQVGGTEWDAHARAWARVAERHDMDRILRSHAEDCEQQPNVDLPSRELLLTVSETTIRRGGSTG